MLQDDAFLLAVCQLNDTAGPVRDDIVSHRSEDRGETWQAAGTLGPAPFDCVGEGFLSLMQLADGTILFPVYRWKVAGDEPAPRVWGETVTHDVFRSNDGGRTWGDPVPTYDGACETHLLQLQNGSLLAAFRYQRPIRSDDSPDILERWGARRDAAPGTPIFKHVFLADSKDGGNTWEDLRPLLTEEGKPLLVFGEAYGQLVQVPDGRAVLVYDRRYPYEGYEVRGRVSQDGGKTWGPDIYHVSFGAGYPASVALEDGTIVTVTGNTPFDDHALPVGQWQCQAVRWRLP